MNQMEITFAVILMLALIGILLVLRHDRRIDAMKSKKKKKKGSKKKSAPKGKA